MLINVSPVDQCAVGKIPSRGAATASPAWTVGLCMHLSVAPPQAYTSPTPHALGSRAMLDSSHHGLIVPPPVSPHCPLSLRHRRPVAYFPVPLTWACPPPTSGRQRKGKNLGGNLPPSRAHSDSVGRWTLLLVPQLPLGTRPPPRVALGQN